MRSRTASLALAIVGCCSLSVPAHASAAGESLGAYEATIETEDAGALNREGVDIEHALGHRETGKAELALFPDQAERLAAAGVTLRPAALQTQTTAAAKAQRWSAERAAPSKPDTGGDSPNPFYDVYRSYMEPGGIHDEMVALAAKHPDIIKLETIGRSTLGKPIIVLKFTKDAKSTPDGTRPAVLYSSNNHAREWIAAETNRRLALYIAENKDDPKMVDLLATTEMWVSPIQNPDGYDYTFTCGPGSGTAANVPCGLTRKNGSNQFEDGDGNIRPSNNRLWRKTLRDNNGDGIYGNTIPVNGVNVGDGVDPNRNYPAKRAIDEEGASNNPSGETYRGPFALSEPENLAVDRLLRKIDFKANVNYHSAAQLILTPVSYTTDYEPVDTTIFDAITGVDGDSAVEPYIPERSSDLYESNGDTIDNGYLNYGVIGWTPELDECATAGGTNCLSSFVSPDEEDKVQAIFAKNLPMALNIANSAGALDRPANYQNDQSQYQIKKTRDIEAKPFDVSFGASQDVEAIVRRSLGAVDVRATITGPTHTGSTAARTVDVRAQEFTDGERYGDVKGVYFKRVRANLPSQFNAQGPTVAGDTIAVTIIAGGLRQRFSYRVEGVPADAAKKRIMVVQAEDYRGTSPNKTAGYGTAPRYGAEYVASLEAAGYEVTTYDVDAPPLNAAGSPAMKYPTALGVLNHFDAVVYETGDDFLPQDATEMNPRLTTGATSVDGSQAMADWSHHAMLEMRDFMNEGGKILAAGRNVHVPFTSTSASLSATGPTTWAPDPVEFFTYPVNNAGDDDMAGTAFRRYRGISNDTWQNYLGIVGRQGGYATAPTVPQGTSTTNTPSFAGQPVLARSDGLFAGLPPITVNDAAGNDPAQDGSSNATPRAKSPTRLRTFSSVSTQEPLRQERVELDYANAGTIVPASAQGGGAAISTPDTVTFGFGLEQVDEATRDELVKRSMEHLLPATDTKAPTAIAFKQPVDSALLNTFDPIEVDVTAADDSGDMKEVRLYADDALVGTARTFPFQYRYLPPASAAGTTITLKAIAEDAAGNVSAPVTKTVAITAAAGPTEAPLAVGKPTLSGSPVVGATLTCTPGGFTNQPDAVSYAWTAGGNVIAGASDATLTLTDAQLGRAVACVTTARNEGGDVDATSESLTVGPATPAPVAGGSTVTVTTPVPPAPAPTLPGTTARAAVRLVATASCRYLSGRRGMTCRVTPKGLPTGSSLRSSMRRQNTRTTTARTAKGTVALTLRTKARIKGGSKAVLAMTSGSRKGTITVAAGQTGVRQLR